MQGGGGDGGPLNAVAAAAARTQEEPGGRAVAHVVVTKANGESLPIAARMVYDAEGRARAVLRMPPSVKGGMRMDMVADGAVMYMSSPKFGTLPGGAKWMKLDLEAAEGLEVPAPTSDPTDELARLEASEDVQKLGTEDVRGEPMTHYRGTIGVSDTLQRLREAGEDGNAAIVEKYGVPIHFEVWIDAEGLVRRMRIVNLQPHGEGGETSTDMTMDFYDFGAEPKIEVPDSSEVFDVTEQTKEELESSNNG